MGDHLISDAAATELREHMAKEARLESHSDELERLRKEVAQIETGQKRRHDDKVFPRVLRDYGQFVVVIITCALAYQRLDSTVVEHQRKLDTQSATIVEIQSLQAARNERLAGMESRNNIFPDVDYRIYAGGVAEPATLAV